MLVLNSQIGYWPQFSQRAVLPGIQLLHWDKVLLIPGHWASTAWLQTKGKAEQNWISKIPCNLSSKTISAPLAGYTKNKCSIPLWNAGHICKYLQEGLPNGGTGTLCFIKLHLLRRQLPHQQSLWVVLTLCLNITHFVAHSREALVLKEISNRWNNGMPASFINTVITLLEPHAELSLPSHAMFLPCAITPFRILKLDQVI